MRRASYLAATERCASRGLKSGVVYDALQLVEAERARAPEPATPGWLEAVLMTGDPSRTNLLRSSRHGCGVGALRIPVHKHRLAW